MLKIDLKSFPGSYLVSCDEHELYFEFEADTRDEAKEALYVHIWQQHSDYHPDSNNLDGTSEFQNEYRERESEL